MDKNELVDIIANNLPIGTEDAENLVDAITSGYTWGRIDYAMAMSSRDRTIKSLIEENKRLREQIITLEVNEN